MTTVQKIAAEYRAMIGMAPVERVGILARRYDCRRLDIRECLRHQGISLDPNPNKQEFA